MVRTLLTGGSGFVAGHVLDLLLKRGHSVVATVRSESKGRAVLTAHGNPSKDVLDFVVIADIAAQGAFKGLDSYGLEAVVHVASPFHYNVTDPKKDLLDPAVLGTTGVLREIQGSCPSVKRVVVTSSFAAIIDMNIASTGADKTYSEADWSPLTEKDAYANPMFAYAASKALAEKAAWDFMEKERPSFSLATMNPPMVFGPVTQPPQSLDSVNTSNQVLAAVLSGKHKNGIPPTGLPLWVDVRDVALAHVKAMELEEAAGQRFFLVTGSYTNAQMTKIVWENFPELRDRLPEESKWGDFEVQGLNSFGYDNSKATKILGLEWTPYEKTVIDSVKSFKSLLD
ncbi:Ketoreductase azaE [Paramyrothecium foliicola]|nr:Ketoreductase azaE [Paramyrothecium foliicola]